MSQGREGEVEPFWGPQGRLRAPQTCWLQPKPKQDMGCRGGCAPGSGFPRRLRVTVEKDGGTLTQSQRRADCPVPTAALTFSHGLAHAHCLCWLLF